MHSPPLARSEGTLDEAMAAGLSEPLDRAISLLDADPPSLQVREAEHLLRDVEVRLGLLGMSHADRRIARRMLELRDELSSHLRAASICASDELPPAVIAHLLLRGAWRAQSTLADRSVVASRSVASEDEDRAPNRFLS